MKKKIKSAIIAYIALYAVLCIASLFFIQLDSHIWSDDYRYKYIIHKTVIYNISVAKYYFIALPIAASIPIIYLGILKLCNSLSIKDVNSKNAFLPFPFREISDKGVLGITLETEYPDVVSKLIKLNLIDNKYGDGLLKTYKPFPDISFSTPIAQNPFIGVKRLEYHFLQYKLDKIVILLSYVSNNDDTYKDLNLLFSKIWRDQPSILDTTLFWKNYYSTISINKTKGTITLELTK